MMLSTRRTLALFAVFFFFTLSCGVNGGKITRTSINLDEVEIPTPSWVASLETTHKHRVAEEDVEAKLGAGDVSLHRMTDPTPIGDLPWTLEYLSTKWLQPDPDDASAYEGGLTVFTYRVVTTDRDLSSWIVARGSEACPPGIGYIKSDRTSSMWSDYAYDSRSDISGWKERFGQDENSVHTYELFFQGKLGTGPVDYVLRGSGGLWGTASTWGPDCAQQLNYAEFATVPEDRFVACNSTAIETPAGATDRIQESSLCENNYDIYREHRLEQPLENGAVAPPGVTALISCYTQVVKVRDTVAPEIQGSFLDRVLECGRDTVPTAPPDNITAIDNCAEEDGVHVNDACTLPRVGHCDGHQDITWTFTATDDCGNSECITQDIHVRDTLPPELHGVPDHEFEGECDGSLPSDVVVPNVTATDLCDCLVGEVKYEQIADIDSCGLSFKLRRRWSITDCCGNEAVAERHFIYEDLTPPKIEVDNDPGNVTVECHERPADPTASASDVCSENPVKANLTKTESFPNRCDQNKTFYFTWEACDECGWVSREQRYIEVYDIRAPTLTPTPPRYDTATCGRLPSPPTVAASDLCDPNVEDPDVVPSVDQPLDLTQCSYDVTYTWSAEDDCGNPAEVKQTVAVVDDEPPFFTHLPPADHMIECTASMPDFDVRADDHCNFANVTRREVDRVGGLCGNYRVLFNYTAEDDCGNKAYVLQNVTVRDSQEPWALPNDVLCFLPEAHAPFHVIHNVSDPGTFFDTGDDCSDVTVDITSCISDQDIHFGIREEGQGGFTEDCYYEASTDSLYVRVRFDWSDPLGRIFFVAGTSTDACGHSTNLQRLIWLPRDEHSVDHTDEFPGGFPDDFDFATECGTVEIDCDEQCPCEYNTRPCVEDSGDAIQVDLAASYPKEGPKPDTTEFKYEVTGLSTEAAFSIELNLRELDIMSISPDNGVVLGFVAGTSLYGVTWPAGSGSTFSIVLHGNHDSTQTVRAQATTPNPSEGPGSSTCSPPVSVAGPNLVSLPAGGVAIGGSVAITSTVDSDDDSAAVPVSDVIVLLVSVDNPMQPLHMTATAADGSYAFTGVAGDIADLRAVIDQAGQLDATYSAPGTFLLGQGDRSLTYPFGDPMPVTAGSGNNFALLLNEHRDPPYLNPRGDASFKGASRPASWWAHQIAFATGAGYGVAELDSMRTSVALDLYADMFPACAAPLATIGNTSSAPEDLAFVTAALNQLSGRGIADAYAPVGDWFLAWSAHILCRTTPASGPDRAIAQRLLARINEAY